MLEVNFIICTKFDDKLARVSEFTQCNSFVGTVCVYGLMKIQDTDF